MCTTKLQGLIYPVIPSPFPAPSHSCTAVSSSRLQQTDSVLQTESFSASQLSLHPALRFHHSFCCHQSKLSCKKESEKPMKGVKTVANYGLALVGWRRIYARTQNPWIINEAPFQMFPGTLQNGVYEKRGECIGRRFGEHRLLYHAELQRVDLEDGICWQANHIGEGVMDKCR